MKKNDNSFAGKIIDALDKIGLTAGELAIVQDYLDSDPRDESILDAITPRDLSVLPRDGFTSCYKLAGQLSDKKARDNDSLSAFAEIAFAVGQWSAYLMFSNYYSTLYNSVRGIISDEKYVAIAAGYGASCFMGNRGRLAQDTVWLYAEDHPRTVIKALDYCGAAGGRTRLFAEMALFCQLYNKYPTFVEQGGIEDTLALFDTEYIPYVLQAFADSMLGLTAQETARIVDYVKSDISPVLPLDSDISSLCEKAGVERIDANLPAVSALLLCERSDICARMLRIYTLCDLSCVFDIACHSFRHSDVDALLHRLESSPYFSSGDTGRYFLYAVHYKLDGTAKRIYGMDRDCLDKALDMANAQNVIDIIEKLRRLDPEEYKRKIDPAGEYAERLREKTARGISELVSGGREELYDFITGKSDAGKLLPCLDTYKTELSMSYVTYLSTAAEQVLKGDAINGRLRLVKLLGGYYYDVLKDLRTENRYNSKISYQEFERLFDDLDMYALPRGLQYDLAAGMYDSCYSDESKASLRDCMCRVIEKRLAQDTGAAAEDLSKCGAVVRSCAVSVYAGDAERYKKELLSYAQDTSKLVRTELVGAAARQNGWDSDIIAMLGSKKSAERETAVDIMIARGAEKYTGQLAQALEKEKSAKLRSRIQEALSVTDNTDGKALSERQTARDIIANLLKGGKKRTLDWLFASPMPEVRSISGESTDTDALQALMLAYSSMPRPGVSEDAKIIAAGLNAADLGAAARETLARWLDSGADAKKKWVLYFASIHGGDAAAQTIISNINQWPLQSRGAIAAEAVNALALSPAPSALMTVDSLSRKCKFKQVKSAAQKALDFAAQQLGITSEQLADRIVPDLGFDTSMTRVFDYGPRNFTVRLTPALDLIITDQTGKRVKNLPAVGQKDDTEIAAKSAEQFKLLKKQLKAVTATQKLRLELALSSGRQWTAEAWRQLFVNNPVMRQFAIGLIWGTYDGSKLIDTFRYMEDGSFNTVDEDEYQLPDSAVIGLVHPIELDKDALDGWKQQLEDYEITQPIEQLGRKVFTLTDEEREADSLDRFGGIMLNGLSLSGKLLGMGWYRGSVEDAGMYYCYYRENIAEGVSAVMRFSGSYVGDQDGTVTVYNALFYKAGTVQYGSYVYDDVKPQDRIKLAGITPRCFSETILQLEKATASGSDRDEKWREDMGARFR